MDCQNDLKCDGVRTYKLQYLARPSIKYHASKTNKFITKTQQWGPADRLTGVIGKI